MGFFGHMIASRADLTHLFADSEPLDVMDGVHGLQVFGEIDPDWDAIARHDQLLIEHAADGFLSASVYDSDGALLSIGVPGQNLGHAWLQLDGAVGFFFQPWSPFDEDGRRLSPAEEAKQDAEWEAEAAQYREQMVNAVSDPAHAAALCVELATSLGLKAQAPDVVEKRLQGQKVFVEDTIAELWTALGILPATVS